MELRNALLAVALAKARRSAMRAIALGRSQKVEELIAPSFRAVLLVLQGGDMRSPSPVIASATTERNVGPSRETD